MTCEGSTYEDVCSQILCLPLLLGAYAVTFEFLDPPGYRGRTLLSPDCMTDFKRFNPFLTEAVPAVGLSRATLNVIDGGAIFKGWT